MANSYTDPGNTTNLLDDLDFTLTQAGGWKRFANLIIDSILAAIFWQVFDAIIGYRFVLSSHSQAEFIFGLWFQIYLLAAVQNALFYTVIETLGRGKTIGKLITGTRAVNEDGSYIGFKKALLRSLSRQVPFEVFSALGSPCWPWHDRWTKTYVIDERQSRLPAQA